jgi:hypothetical protein
MLLLYKTIHLYETTVYALLFSVLISCFPLYLMQNTRDKDVVSDIFHLFLVCFFCHVHIYIHAS